MADDFKAWSEKTKARMVALIEESVEEGRKYVDPLKVIPALPFTTENIELSGRLIKAAFQYMPEGATEIRSILTEPARAANTARAADEFDILVDAVELVGKTLGIKLRQSAPCINKIYDPVTSMVRAKEMPRPGLGRLKRAIRAAQARQK